MIRFNHALNTWQRSLPNHRYIKWEDITADEARGFFDAGYSVTLEGEL